MLVRLGRNDGKGGGKNTFGTSVRLRLVECFSLPSCTLALRHLVFTSRLCPDINYPAGGAVKIHGV